jgi:peptide/nickel transport system substrate-binding protein
MVSALAVPSHGVQPPVDTSTYWVGTIGQPRRVDPARAYDTASGEFIMNVYEPLVFFRDKPTYDYASMSINVTEAGMADLSQFEGVLAEKWWFETRDDGGVSLYFKIRTGIPFQPWIDAAGNVRCEYLTIYDVEYTFKRMLVQDMIGAPSWMIALPFTGHMFLGWEIDEDESTMNTIEPVGVDGRGERKVRDLINSAIEVVNETTIRFNMLPGKTWPEVALLQIFSQTWGCIVNKNFCIEHGSWNGAFYDGWSTDYRCRPSYLYSPLDRYYAAKSKYPSTDPDVPAMCGTGPYISRKAGTKNTVDWDTATLTWVARAWENFPDVPDPWKTYRGGWNDPGTNKHSIRTIVVKGVAEWPTRKMMFLKGEFDSVAVPRANMWELLEEGQQYTPIEGIRLYYHAPALSNDAMFYCFTVDPKSPYVPKVGTGATAVPKPDLFKDVHMRAAFSHAINFTVYLRDAWFNEAIQPASWWVEGLQPAAAKNTSLVPHNIDLAKIEQELRAAGVWESGFEVTIVYNLGNDQRKIAAEMVRDTFRGLGTKFVVNVVGVDWPVFLDYMEMFYMPVFFVGWLADFAHPDNFVRPYMHSHGDFAYYQNYSDPYVDDLIDRAIVETDISEQCRMYQELQYIYWRDYVSLPLIQGLVRRWERNWVRGWYYNQLYPGLYFYDLWKTLEAPPTAVNVGVPTIELSPVANITTWLLSQPYHAPKPPVPWMKKNPNTGSTNPIAEVTARVKRYDSEAVIVYVYVVWYGVTSKGHTVEFGYIVWPFGPGAEYALGPENVSNVMPAVGQYELYVEPFPLGNTYNTNLTARFDGGYFYALGYCDVNKDLVVDGQDLQMVKRAIPSRPGETKWRWSADVNCDGIVDGVDLTKVKRAIPTNYSEA